MRVCRSPIGKGLPHLVGRPQYLVLGGWRLPLALLRRILSGTARLTLAPAEVPLRGAGSRLHGSMKVSAHLRCFLSSCRALYQSSEHAVRNFAIQRSCRVLRRWQLRHSQRRLLGVNALSIAAGAQSTSDIDRKPVVHLFGRVAAYLTERVLYLFGMLAGCDAICIQAVGVPVRPDVCGALVAPAADAVDRRLFPAGRPVHKSSGVCRRMASVVQHEAPELALSDVSLQVLPRPLTMAVLLGPAACLLYHRNACNTAENGYAMVLLPSK